MKCLIVYIELIAAVMLHVERLFLYLNSAGQFEDDGDFHSFGARLPPMRPSPEQQWTRGSDVQRDLHRSFSFEHMPTPDPPMRPRSPPPHPRVPPHARALPRTRSPLHPKPAPSLLSMDRISRPFDDYRHLRSTFSDARPSSDSFHPGGRPRLSPAAQPRFPKTAVDTVPKYTLPIQPTSDVHQLVDKGEKYQHQEKARHGFSSSASSSAKLQRRLLKLAHGKWHRLKHSDVQLASSHTMNTGAVLNSQEDLSSTKADSASGKAPETLKAAEAGSQLPADTSEAASESAVPVRPEDIIIIRRYNIDGSATEKKPEDAGQNAKRHVVRLVRNNVLTPLAASASSMDAGVKRHDAKPDAGARLQSVVKRRKWSGVVKTTHVAAAEGGTATDRVDDGIQPDHTRRSVDIYICHGTNCSIGGVTVWVLDLTIERSWVELPARSPSSVNYLDG